MAWLDNFVAFYKCDETTGDWLDAHAGLTLTDHNGSGTAAGVNGTARSLASASSQYASRADNAPFSVADIDFTILCRIKLTTKTSSMAIVSKCADPASDINIPYLLNYNTSLDRLRFTVGNTGISQAVLADNFGAVSTGVWISLRGWHDATANTVNIQVNNGTVNSQSYSGGAFDDTGPFEVGALNNLGTPFLFFNGLMDDLGFLKRVLTTQEWTDYVAGLTYPFVQGGPAPHFLRRSRSQSGGLITMGV